MPYYAQLQGGIVVAVTETSGPLEGPDLIELAEYDTGLLGQEHVGGGVFEPVEAAPIRHVSVGAFFDRFGAAKWGILADETPSVKAVVADASVRKYIDLDNPQLPAGLGIITAAGHVIDEEAILNDPIQPEELP